MPGQAHDLAAELRAALRSSAPCLSDAEEGRARYLLRSHVLETLGQAVAKSGVEALLVKGSALALTVYDKPWHRDMADVDVVVRPKDKGRLVAAFEEVGCRLEPRPAGRIWSVAALGETPLVWRGGAVTLWVEIHHTLDKLVARPVDYEAIFARASRRDDLRGFLFPSVEDQALLVVLHAASAELDHPIALLDLELLFRRGLDVAALEERARSWRLDTALYVCLALMQALGAPSVPGHLVERFLPSALRRRALARHYDVTRYPAARAAYRQGLPWVMKQAPLRDDLGRWLLGLGRYSAHRVVERSLSAFAAGRALGRRLGAVYPPEER